MGDAALIVHTLSKFISDICHGHYQHSSGDVGNFSP